MTTFDKSTSIGFIGAGAVGGSLAGALHDAGYPVVAVASRTFASAETFASRIPDCVPIQSVSRSWLIPSGSCSLRLRTTR